ncbi:MAG: hypothetical protein ACI94Y_004277 [Maribacter sp.]
MIQEEQNKEAELMDDEFSEDEEKVLNSIKMNRIILPIIIGLGVIGYMLYSKWDHEAFLTIKWNGHTLFWIFMAGLMMIIRHLAYAFRLRVLTENFFKWKKAIQLIFIWEFSSAVSPTSVGGSAVALFVLSQEKLGAAKTTALVIYTIVVDSVFFITAIPFMLLIFGSTIVPKLEGLAFGSWTFYVTFIIMLIYGSFFFYGLFFSPKSFKTIAISFCKLWFMKRFRNKAEELGDDIILASSEISKRKWDFHLKAYLSTALAWSTRFIVLNCLIIAFADKELVSLDFWVQSELYAKLQSLFVILLLLPSPGGAGFAEVVFGKFLSQAGYNLEETVTFLIALIWRLLSYYPYLIAGAIIIPWWLAARLNARKKAKLEKMEAEGE